MQCQAPCPPASTVGLLPVWGHRRPPIVSFLVHSGTTTRLPPSSISPSPPRTPLRLRRPRETSRTTSPGQIALRAGAGSGRGSRRSSRGTRSRSGPGLPDPLPGRALLTDLTAAISIGLPGSPLLWRRTAGAASIVLLTALCRLVPPLPGPRGRRPRPRDDDPWWALGRDRLAMGGRRLVPLRRECRSPGSRTAELPPRRRWPPRLRGPVWSRADPFRHRATSLISIARSRWCPGGSLAPRLGLSHRLPPSSAAGLALVAGILPRLAATLSAPADGALHPAASSGRSSRRGRSRSFAMRPSAPWCSPPLPGWWRSHTSGLPWLPRAGAVSARPPPRPNAAPHPSRHPPRSSPPIRTGENSRSTIPVRGEVRVKLADQRRYVTATITW